MLKFGNREFRNLQEQVLKNMCDIQDIEQGATVLAAFGIKVVGQVNEASALPAPTTYKGNLGDAFLVGTEAPYLYYIYAKAYEGQEQASWFNLGEFPKQGPKGDQGNAAGFGTVSATATSVVGNPTVSVSTSGTNEAKNIAFEFGIPDVNPEYVEANPTASATGTLEKLRVDNTVYGVGGGGSKIYKHTITNIIAGTNTADAKIIVYSTSSDLIDDQYKFQYNTENWLQAVYVPSADSQVKVYQILSTMFMSSQYKLYATYLDGETISKVQISTNTYTDTVTEI